MLLLTFEQAIYHTRLFRQAAVFEPDRVSLLPLATVQLQCEAMRLLRRSDTGEFCLTQFRDEAIPPYAILSHRWGSETEEVSFRDFVNGVKKNTSGYEKLLFCVNQARRDGLRYFLRRLVKETL